MKKRDVNLQKLREEEQAIGAIYKQYIETFQESSALQPKTFVKSATLYAESGKESAEHGQLYTPKPLIKLKNRLPSPKSSPKLKPCKAKSNLRSLGDELKMLQHERMTKEPKIAKIDIVPSQTLDNDCTTSTNLFVSNLNPSITEYDLIKLFGIYGPLASVKIMWPRGEDAGRTSNCGFVAFMSRIDAERALDILKNRDDMRINWGKAVKIPTYPVHIPTKLYKLYSPPPPSGLPFNAQIVGSKKNCENLMNTLVKVTIPFNRNQLMLIHRMVEFVVRNGPEFESLIMIKELNNSDYNFLADFKSPEHTYYRWKLFSILNGDPKNSWSMVPFRMFKSGSIWIPPTAPNYQEGMPKHLIKTINDEKKLTDNQINQLIELIQGLTLSRASIAKAMVFFLNYSQALNDSLEILGESFKNITTNPLKKIARLYLLSDILQNCKLKRINLEILKNENYSEYCVDIYKNLHSTYYKISFNNDKHNFRVRILKVLRSWMFFRHYDSNFIMKLENLFLHNNEDGEIDNDSLSDEPLDGANLLKRSNLSSNKDCLIINSKVDMFCS